MTRSVLVTGVAGFIGSAIARKHLSLGDRVIGVDCLTDYYTVAQKRRNLSDGLDGLDFIEEDLLSFDLRDILRSVDAVYHQAGQPGVRKSWGEHFADYTRNNIGVSQHILEQAKDVNSRAHLVYASSSSVYGDAPSYPTMIDTLPSPVSPYGVTKLAAEHLWTLYGKNYGLNTASLRYFTVYGPGQRPDMAFHRFIMQILRGEALTIFGDGTQVRDFTFVEDVVQANLIVAESAVPRGSVYNISGGSSASLKEVIEMLRTIHGADFAVEYGAKVLGDVIRTGGDSAPARNELGWFPRSGLFDGLSAEYEWCRALEAERLATP